MTIYRDKITSWVELKKTLTALRGREKCVVFTNGCFDILHVGHTRLLQEAKKQGDVLVLGLNTDESVRRLKGSSRPVNSQDDRAELLAALDCVDFVVLFEQDTPCDLISFLKPDVHVKGGNYDPKNYERMPEAKIVHEYGGRVHIVPLIDGRSTTRVIEKVQQ